MLADASSALHYFLEYAYHQAIIDHDYQVGTDNPNAVTTSEGRLLHGDYLARRSELIAQGVSVIEAHTQAFNETFSDAMGYEYYSDPGIFDDLV